MDVGNESSSENARSAESARESSREPVGGTRLADAFSKLDDVAPAGREQFARRVRYENRLVQARLGIAASLFTALRAKHPPTAAHSLRVAMGASCWAIARRMEEDRLDQIEIAALLHDVGKIGVPDRVLLKPGKLSSDERLTIEQHRQVGVQILLSCCASQEILDIVKYTPAWYSGEKTGFDRTDEDLPLGARMVAIVDAYDAMTTDHVYRRAMPKERALAELYAFAGRQFDPDLVDEFSDLMTREQIDLHRLLAQRWLADLQSCQSNRFWSLGFGAESIGGDEESDRLFYLSILDNIHDGVVFIDSDLQIQLWNRPAERLTGLVSGAVVRRHWTPALVQMRDESNCPIEPEECPVRLCLETGEQSLRRLVLQGRDGEPVSVDVHFIPVIDNEGRHHGVTMVLHDTSHQVSLEQRLEALQHQVTRDPLTQVANRAEFDRMLAQFVQTHLRRQLPCALVICDLDHFKQINDTYGHQAGDDVLISFASTLRRFARTGDFVARYGGEEFVVLCADCTCDAAARRAEELRADLERTPQPALSGNPLTASFGVTQLQAGDTPETMLRRADRALLQAKESGRNMVVQLGTGDIELEDSRQTILDRWRQWFQPNRSQEVARCRLATCVPMTIAAKKLMGFIADHRADILLFEENQAVLRVQGSSSPALRRQGDRGSALDIGLRFSEVQEHENAPRRTEVEVLVRSVRSRDRRRKNVRERARLLVASLKSYLMATEVP